MYIGGFVDPPHLIHEGNPSSVDHLVVNLCGSDVQFLPSDLYYVVLSYPEWEVFD
mgnify:CR=1 FL=1